MPLTLEPVAAQHDGQRASEGQRAVSSQATYSPSNDLIGADEDWRTLTDFEERRRVQSRIAQRHYRQRQKQLKSQRKPEEVLRTTQLDLTTNETTQGDLSAANVSLSNPQDIPPYIFSEPSIPDTTHQQLLPLGDESLVAQLLPFLSQFPSPRPLTAPEVSPAVTPSAVEFGAPPQPIHSLSFLSAPETPQQQYPSLFSDNITTSPEFIPLTSPPPSYTRPWTYETAPVPGPCHVLSQQQPAWSSNSAHHHMHCPVLEHCQRSSPDCIIYKPQYTYHSSTSADPRGGPSHCYLPPLPPHSCNQQHDSRGQHAQHKVWAGSENHNRDESGCRFSGSCGARSANDSYTGRNPTYQSQPYLQTTLPPLQPCCCGQRHVHSAIPGSLAYANGFEMHGSLGSSFGSPKMHHT